MRLYTLTPNPALDLSGHVPRIVANEKNYVVRARRDPGGNGLNAARIASRLSARVTVMGFLGGEVGAQIETLLAGERLHQRFTRIQADTRINVTVTNDFDHKQTRLTFPGPRVTAREIKALRADVKALRGPGIFVLGGSLPPGCKPALYSELARLANTSGLGICADLPARFLKQVLDGTSPRLLLIKPNQVELEELLRKKLRTDRQIADAALKLTSRSALVCVSLAERGAIFAAAERAWLVRAPRIHARGSVGAGDSMVGAMVSRLAHWKISRPEQVASASEKQFHDVFAYGVAAGAATAQSEGTSLGAARDIRRLKAKVRLYAL